MCGVAADLASRIPLAAGVLAIVLGVLLPIVGLLLVLSLVVATLALGLVVGVACTSSRPVRTAAYRTRV